MRQTPRLRFRQLLCTDGDSSRRSAAKQEHTIFRPRVINLFQTECRIRSCLRTREAQYYKWGRFTENFLLQTIIFFNKNRQCVAAAHLQRHPVTLQTKESNRIQAPAALRWRKSTSSKFTGQYVGSRADLKKIRVLQALISYFTGSSDDYRIEEIDVF